MILRSCLALVLMLLTTGCLVTRSQLREQSGQLPPNRGSNAPEQQATIPEPPEAAEPAEPTVEEVLRELKGRMDILEKENAELREQKAGQGEQLQLQLAQSNERVALLQEEIVKLEAKIVDLAANKTPAKNNQPSPEKGLFAQAEQLFAAKEWKRAALEYQKYRDRHPKGKNFAEATYKMGVCFQELGLNDEAKVFYEEVIARFPQSSEAKRARVRLKKISS